MYELIQVSDNDYYVKSPTNIGLVKLNDKDVCIIDSGNDKEAGRKIRQILDANGWNLVAIYSTHSHADHIGGNKYLQSQTGCKIYSPSIECDFTNHTVLEPAFLYGGYPMKELRHKFLMAQESDCRPLTDSVVPGGLEIIPLPGHSFDMVGFRTKDDVVFLADCISGKATLDKYKIGFVYDVGEYIATLEKVRDMKAKIFIPAHVEATEDISELAQYNIDSVMEVADHIVEMCKEPITVENIVKRLFDDYGLKMTMEEYVLISSTVRSYLSWLKDCGRLNPNFIDNILYWERA